jgi:hypothetical protein
MGVCLESLAEFERLAKVGLPVAVHPQRALEFAMQQTALPSVGLLFETFRGLG